MDVVDGGEQEGVSEHVGQKDSTISCADFHLNTPQHRFISSLRPTTTTMLSKFVLTQLVCFFTLLVGVFAAPASLEALEKRDVFVPPVLYPHAGTIPATTTMDWVAPRDGALAATGNVVNMTPR